MKAIGFKVLVKILDQEKLVQKINGLVIETDDCNYEVGEVVSHGDRCVVEYPDIKDGDKVYFQKGAGVLIREENEKFKVINISDILVICQK